MTDWIAKTYLSDAGWDHLETLVDIGDRMAGSEGEREGAEATRDALAAAGARNARLEEFPLQGWTRGSSSLAHVDSGEELDCIALPRSPSETVEAELLDLGYGLPEEFAETDVEGKVVMVASNVPDYYDRFPHRREKYYYAVEGGAVGFVFRNHVEGCLPPTGSVGGAERRTANNRTQSDDTDEDSIGDIPAVGVSKEAGTRLGRRFSGEAVSVSVDAEIHDATSQNVHADLGPDTDERVLVTSHVDAHDVAEGAMDNGGGTAMLVELASALVEREDELETRVEFVAFGAEEVGLDGSEYHDSVTDEDSVKAIVNADGVVRGRTLQFYTHTFDELEAAVERVSERLGDPAKVIPREGFRGDQWPLVRWGVPGYFVSGVKENTEGRGWGHTSADTFDKLDRRNLREQAIFLAELVVDLAKEGTEIPHRTPEEVAASFEAEGRVEGIKVVGDWPYDF